MAHVFEIIFQTDGAVVVLHLYYICLVPFAVLRCRSVALGIGEISDRSSRRIYRRALAELEFRSQTSDIDPVFDYKCDLVVADDRFAVQHIARDCHFQNVTFRIQWLVLDTR